MARKLRLGIDVGGTFTDVVAIDAETRQVAARVKVPTTHTAPEGVAAGIVGGIDALFARGDIQASEVAFIAHSTTQATNALLEGDVAEVGVLGLLDGFAPLARLQMRFPKLELAPGVPFQAQFRFSRAGDGDAVHRAIASLLEEGAQAVAVSQPFAVDRPEAESAAVSDARAQGLFATAGHEVSSMYGLRARTRTAALNAAILPKMVRTARMTDDAVKRATIAAPLMVMRSDGGVMDVREMERRPILTLRISPCSVPQNSVQMMLYLPTRVGVNVSVFTSPGTISALSRISGTQNEWITSYEETCSVTCWPSGKCSCLTSPLMPG